MAAERRLITIGHSYVVGENRRLAHEMARAGAGRWSVTAVAPAAFHGDLRRVELERISGESCAVVPLRMRFDRSAHLMSYRGLRDALSGGDLVHAWEEPYILAGAQIARAVPRGVPLAYATFQNLAKRYPWPFSRFERQSLARASGWIAFGQSVEATLGSRDGYVDLPHRVIPPGVDVDRFRPDRAAGARMRRSAGWQDDDLVVGFLGRFAPQKGIRDLCLALERMRAPWRALFVGGGALQGELERFGRAHPGRVHIATRVAHSDVPPWINAMTILCAPSRTTARWREQFGRMLIEAMACGVPVVASGSGEMPSVVGDAGRIVEEGDAVRWAEQLDALLEDAGARGALGRAGMQRARSRYAWPVVARQHLDFFESLIGSGANA
ncbi:MAG TPA: glycosyltransferase family 4 protein [Vicinamibacterales bacterium]|nr:glycosyltransferase family 4 protein [Vicinamibacterales bacterium]